MLWRMNRRTSLTAIASLVFLAAGTHRAHASQIVREMNETDAKLNATYQRVLKRMPDDAARDALKAAQRAWIAWRDAEMALSRTINSEAKGGIFKQIDLTNERIAQLEAIRVHREQ